MEDGDDCGPQGLVPQPSLAHRLTNENFLKLPKSIRNLLAGGVAGIAAKTIVAPMDRIKILYQVSSARFRILDVPRVALAIIRDEGLLALWKGNLATMIRVFPYSGIQFMVFESCKSFLLNRHRLSTEEAGINVPEYGVGMSPGESLLAGSTAGAVSVVATYPLDLTRAQLAVIRKKSHNVGFTGILRKNYSERGIVGLYRGITPTLLGILPYSGIAFAINEQGKRKIHSMTGREPRFLEKMFCGGLSGLFAQTITYPLEVTRRRMQTTGLVSAEDGAVHALGMDKNSIAFKGEPTMLRTIRHLFREQGIRGFFKGVSMNWIKGPIAFSISFTMFDVMQGILSTDLERQLRLQSRK